MQTAAFLQLAITLGAIASRINILLEEICGVLELCQEACHRILQIVDPQQAQKTLHLIRSSTNDIENPLLTAKAVPKRPPVVDDTHGEDIGSILQRSQQPSFKGSPKSTAEDDVSLSLDLETNQVAEAPPSATTNLNMNTIRTTVIRNSAAVIPRHNVVKRKSAAGSQVKAASSKKKRKNDEIDDIFGF